MTKVQFIPLMVLSMLLTGCSSFPVGSSWQVKHMIEPNREYIMTFSFQEAGKLVMTHEDTGKGDNTQHSEEGKYKLKGNRLNIYDPKKKQWEEGSWRIEGNTLVLIAVNGEENRMMKVKSREANKAIDSDKK
jgi:hypothetical protein